MKILPLFYFPTTVVWVDDEKIFLETMECIFGPKYIIKKFLSSEACLRFLENYEGFLIRSSFLDSNNGDENHDLLQKSPVEFDITKIHKIIDYPNRRNEISTIIIDYNMPNIDGFMLAEKLENLPIKKLLLTGDTTEDKAVEGFNNNIIDRFIKKTEENMFEKLNTYLENLRYQYFQEISYPLLHHLEAERKLPLSDPVFIKFFEKFCKDKNIEEYYLIDKNGSFLCMDKNNNKLCLAVHTDFSLDLWKNVYSEELPNKHKLSDIEERKIIPFFGVEKEAWQLPPEEWHKHFYQIDEILMGKERYFLSNINLQSGV